MRTLLGAAVRGHQRRRVERLLVAARRRVARRDPMLPLRRSHQEKWRRREAAIDRAIKAGDYEAAKLAIAEWEDFAGYAFDRVRVANGLPSVGVDHPPRRDEQRRRP